MGGFRPLTKFVMPSLLHAQHWSHKESQGRADWGGYSVVSSSEWLHFWEELLTKMGKTMFNTYETLLRSR